MKLVSLTFAIGIMFLVLASCKNKGNSTDEKTVLKNNEDSLSYAIGISVANNLKSPGGPDTVVVDAFIKGFNDHYKSTGLFDLQAANGVIQSYFQKKQMKEFEPLIKEGEKFLADNKTKEGVVTLPSGLQYKVLKEGNGPKPLATDVVKTHYHGTLIDGTVFDSSVERKEPATFPVNGVIQGWQEALPLMKVGSKWQLFVPYNLAYGERGAGQSIKPYSTLIFEIELLGIEPPQKDKK